MVCMTAMVSCLGLENLKRAKRISFTESSKPFSEIALDKNPLHLNLLDGMPSRIRYFKI